jgi:transaldolase|tara:strand:- start:96 stop:770 length:675 start_codon:yes stop_codon:yes gene_type:complete
MKIFLDTADLDMIRPAYDTGLIDGVTTNPTLILRSGRTLTDVAHELAGLLALESISTEVVADTAEEMLEQAQEFITISPAITVKLPCTVEGLKACKELSKVGVKTNVTLVFSVAQAILAAKAGATYISPFVGRWEDNSVDGLELIQKIRKVYDRMVTPYYDNLPDILGASVRDVRQVEKCAEYGADVVTIPPLVFWKMYKNVMTEKGLDQFQKDWEDANKNATD